MKFSDATATWWLGYVNIHIYDFYLFINLYEKTEFEEKTKVLFIQWSDESDI